MNPPRPALAEVGNERPGGAHGAEQVGVDLGDELRVSGPLEGPGEPVPGVVEHDVDGPLGEGAARGLQDLLGPGHVERQDREARPAPSSVSLSGWRMVAITFQPRAAKGLAVARPRPVEQPAMKIVLVVMRSPSPGAR